MNNIPYIFGSIDDPFKKIINLFGLVECRNPNDASFLLEISKGRFQIRSLKKKNLGTVYIDFVSGKTAHRRIFGSSRNEAIVKAVGFRKDFIPSILDLTAGLGQDAFVLAAAGCRVHVIERCNIVAALLHDALQRAGRDDEIGQWINERLTLSCEDSLSGLPELPFKPDVVYIDAMFPEKKKTALVHKEIQLLQIIAGQDTDQDRLLEVGENIAGSRVVVKRPSFSGYLNYQKPDFSIKPRNYRFDVYLIKRECVPPLALGVS